MKSIKSHYVHIMFIFISYCSHMLGISYLFHMYFIFFSNFGIINQSFGEVRLGLWGNHPEGSGGTGSSDRPGPILLYNKSCKHKPLQSHPISVNN